MGSESVADEGRLSTASPSSDDDVPPCGVVDEDDDDDDDDLNMPATAPVMPCDACTARSAGQRRKREKQSCRAANDRKAARKRGEAGVLPMALALEGCQPLSVRIYSHRHNNKAQQATQPSS